MLKEDEAGGFRRDTCTFAQSNCRNKNRWRLFIARNSALHYNTTPTESVNDYHTVVCKTFIFSHVNTQIAISVLKHKSAFVSKLDSSSVPNCVAPSDPSTPILSSQYEIKIRSSDSQPNISQAIPQFVRIFCEGRYA